jgi:hypothetical protein
MRKITLNPFCTEMLTLGKIGENEATELTVDVPEQYHDGNIYLDFGLPNGEKTRTPALGEGFSFVVPHELLRAEGWAALDIVYKKDNTTKVLGSFRAKISGAVDAEQTLVLEYKDVIEDLAIRVEALEDGGGAVGPQGEPGTDGATPIKGVDYWTAADKVDIVQDVLDALPDADGEDY